MQLKELTLITLPQALSRAPSRGMRSSELSKQAEEDRIMSLCTSRVVSSCARYSDSASACIGNVGN